MAHSGYKQHQEALNPLLHVKKGEIKDATCSNNNNKVCNKQEDSLTTSTPYLRPHSTPTSWGTCEFRVSLNNTRRCPLLPLLTLSSGKGKQGPALANNRMQKLLVSPPSFAATSFRCRLQSGCWCHFTLPLVAAVQTFITSVFLS